MDLRQFLGILRARWRFIVLTLLLGALITVGLIFVTPKTYQSKASIFVSTPSTGVIDSYQGSLTAQQRAESYAQLAKDADVLQEVSSRLPSVSVADLNKQVTLSVAQRTLLILVDAKANSPELAQQIATVMSDEIISMVKRIETPADSQIPAPIIARLAGKASFNRTAVAPNIPLNAVTGLVLSLLVGVAGAILRDLFDTSIKSVDQVKTLTGSEPLASLPFDDEVKDHPLSSDLTHGALNEAFRVLRTNLMFANLDSKRHTILVTSSVPNEGKTFSATNLAISMAKSGRSVLLLDADMRNPSVANLLGLENSVGLITVLLGRSSVQEAIQEHSSGVSFLGTGPLPPNPAEVLDTSAMRNLVRQLSDAFDVVIIDAPPLLPVADSTILLTEVDGALLLVRHGETHREHLRQAVNRIEAVNGRMLGTILNCAPQTAAYGYYGYGYGYGYGTTYGNEPTPGRRGNADKGRRARR